MVQHGVCQIVGRWWRFYNYIISFFFKKIGTSCCNNSWKRKMSKGKQCTSLHDHRLTIKSLRYYLSNLFQTKKKGRNERLKVFDTLRVTRHNWLCSRSNTVQQKERLLRIAWAHKLRRSDITHHPIKIWSGTYRPKKILGSCVPSEKLYYLYVAFCFCVLLLLFSLYNH